jgi:hypothetical protein
MMPNTTTKKQTTSDPEPRVHKPVDGGQEGLGAEQDPPHPHQPAKGPHGQPGGKGAQLGPQEPQKPDVIGPTQAGHIGQGGPVNQEPGPETMRREARAHGERATHDGDAPILVGREGDTFRTVRLLGGGGGEGEFRVAEPIPQVLVANGSRYLISNREEGTYTWQVP